VAAVILSFPDARFNHGGCGWILRSQAGYTRQGRGFKVSPPRMMPLIA